ncbi:MAG: outer membrane beta-barrel protein [Sphingomonas sp.]
MRILTFLTSCAVVPLSVVPAAALAQGQTTPAPTPVPSQDQTVPAPGQTTTTTTPAPDQGTTAATPAQDQSAAPATTQSTATSAADSESAAANGSTFRGFRLEGQVGWDRFAALGRDRNSLGYGGEFGFDGKLGPLVIGPSFNYWRGDDTVICAAARGGQRCATSYRELGATVRVGVQVAPALLVYGKGGYVNNTHRQQFISSATNGAGQYDIRDDADGWQAGGGAELSLGRHFFVDAEYRYSSYNDNTHRQRVLGGFGIRF